jgi:cytochrome b subunit of formate dehydrogenase
MNKPAQFIVTMLTVSIALVFPTVGAAEDEENQCSVCHGTQDIWEGETLHLFVPLEGIAGDVHSRKGIKCQDCHGGNPNTIELREAHAVEDGFRKIENPADLPAFCGHCHSNAESMRKFGVEAPKGIDVVERFWSGAHGQHLKAKGGPEAATCTSCHPKHAMPPVEPESLLSSAKLTETCGQCHREEIVDLRRSVHHKAGPKQVDGSGTLMNCGQCHGIDAHGMLPTDNPKSPVFLDRQVQMCGDCHQRYRLTYDRSVHGEGLSQSGLLVTAVCSSCHGAHGIYYAADLRSTLHPSKVGATCGQCHQYIEERISHSVHGSEPAPSEKPLPAAKAETAQRKPTCTDCHQGHDVWEAESTEFRLGLFNRCGNCHSRLSQRYRLSLHGQLTELGYAPAASCHDCHGAHTILRMDDPKSILAGANRTETCRKCHPGATASFAQFDPHADDHDAAGYPWLHAVRSKTGSLLAIGVGLFAIHGIFWFTRSFAHARRFGRDHRLVPGTPAVVRLVPTQRVVYFLIFSSFLGLAVTGLPLKFSSFEWARRIVGFLGGFAGISVWHHFFGVLLVCAAIAHLVAVVRRAAARRVRRASWRSRLFGPDSPVPNRRDARDAVRMLRWFVGLGQRPKFENWTYWEKLDYWAVGIGIAVVATSGLMLWLPEWFCLVVPGTVLNLAKTVHTELALAIGGFILLIHIFNSHLRPGKFPLDAAFFTGLASEEHLRTARPEYLERMRREDMLDGILTVTPPKESLRPALWNGGLVLSISLLLLVAILLAVLSK